MARRRQPPQPRRAFPVLRRLPRLADSQRWQRFQTHLSRRILDVAEALPRAEHGPLQRLQYIRDRQRRRARERRERTRPPAASSLTLVGFEVVELFEVENLGRLERALLSLFPPSNRDSVPERSAREVIRDLRAEVGSTKRFSSARLGTIAAPEHYTAWAHKSQDASLSPNSIDVGVHVVRLLPSLYGLSFSFRMSQKANAALTRARAHEEHLPSFCFTRPLSKGFGAWSEQESETPEARKLGDLRDEAKRWAGRYARGLLQSSRGGPDGLAVVDVFRVAGVPDDDSARLRWIERSRPWLQGFHLEIWPDALYDGDGKALLLNRFGPRPPPALLLLREEGRAASEEYACRHLALVWSLSRYLESLEAKLGTRRKGVFRRLRRGRWRIRDGSTISRLNELLFLTRRLQVETTPPFHLNWLFEDVPDFKGRDLYWTGGSFQEFFKEYVQRELTSLETQVNLLRGSLSDQVAVRNLFRMYLLQLTVLLVAVFNVVLTETGQEWIRRVEAWLKWLLG